jgi:hypothetical protein
VAYTDTDELARVLRLRSPTEAQGTAMQRVLDSAAIEIDFECFGGSVDPVAGTISPAGSFGTPYPALAVEVNLERAVEHWRQQESPFGVIGLNETVPIMTARDSWDRHANKLAPLKSSWGIG